MNTLGEYLEYDFFFTPVSVNEVRNVVDSMKNSTPRDEMPIANYKEYYGQLGVLISKICIDSLTLGIFPEKLSIGKVKCFLRVEINLW